VTNTHVYACNTWTCPYVCIRTKYVCVTWHRLARIRDFIPRIRVRRERVLTCVYVTKKPVSRDTDYHVNVYSTHVYVTYCYILAPYTKLIFIITWTCWNVFANSRETWKGHEYVKNCGHVCTTFTCQPSKVARFTCFEHVYVLLSEITFYHVNVAIMWHTYRHVSTRLRASNTYFDTYGHVLTRILQHVMTTLTCQYVPGKYVFWARFRVVCVFRTR
jgi:hypothetical protein